MNLQIKHCKYDLIMTKSVEKRIYTWLDLQIFQGFEDYR